MTHDFEIERQEDREPRECALRETAREVLARFGGRRDAAADYLGISRTTLWRRLREEGGA